MSAYDQIWRPVHHARSITRRWYGSTQVLGDDVAGIAIDAVARPGAGAAELEQAVDGCPMPGLALEWAQQTALGQKRVTAGVP